MHDLKDQIHSLFETGLRPVAADDIARRHQGITAPFPAAKARKAVTVRRVTTAGVGLAAAGCAAALVASQLGGAPARRPGRPAQPAVLDAAYVRHLAAASQLALAETGQAVLSSRQTLGGTFQQTSVDHIAFSGADWNDSFTGTFTVNGEPQQPESAINRVVDGQAYDYFVGAQGLAWYHDTGPDAVARMAIPDPRALLAELEPAARFVRIGSAVVDGVRVDHLQATRLTGLPAISLPDIGSGQRVTALDVWVDSRGVVRQLALSVVRQVKAWSAAQLHKAGGTVSGPAQKMAVLKAPAGTSGVRTEVQATTVVVTFSAIGQPQVITVPPNAIPAYGVG